MFTVIPVLTNSPQTLQRLYLKRGKLIFGGYFFVSGNGLAIVHRWTEKTVQKPFYGVKWPFSQGRGGR